MLEGRAGRRVPDQARPKKPPRPPDIAERAGTGKAELRLDDGPLGISAAPLVPPGSASWSTVFQRHALEDVARHRQVLQRLLQHARRGPSLKSPTHRIVARVALGHQPHSAPVRRIHSTASRRFRVGASGQALDPPPRPHLISRSTTHHAFRRRHTFMLRLRLELEEEHEPERTGSEPHILGIQAVRSLHATRGGSSGVSNPQRSRPRSSGSANLAGPPRTAATSAADGPADRARERSDYSDVTLAFRLGKTLVRIDLDLADTALDDALRKLTRPVGSTLDARNRSFHRMLVDGVPVEYRAPARRIRGHHARVLDFDQPEANDWLAVNQLTVADDKRTRRPDVVLFVNELPLGVVETQGPEQPGVSRTAWRPGSACSPATRPVQTGSVHLAVVPLHSPPPWLHARFPVRISHRCASPSRQVAETCPGLGTGERPRNPRQSNTGLSPLGRESYSIRKDEQHGKPTPRTLPHRVYNVGQIAFPYRRKETIRNRRRGQRSNRENTQSKRYASRPLAKHRRHQPHRTKSRSRHRQSVRYIRRSRKRHENTTARHLTPKSNVDAKRNRTEI